MRTFDCVVVGSSLAASQAVECLAASGRSVVWAPCLWDSGDLATTFVLEAEVSGTTDPRVLEERAERAVARNGRVVSLLELLDIAPGTAGWEVRCSDAPGGLAKAMILALYGSEMAMEDLHLSRDLLNVFLSLEAASCTAMVAGLDLVVYGRGYRALEHAAWLTGRARRVTLCLEDELARWRGTRLWHAMESAAPLSEILERCTGIEIGPPGAEGAPVGPRAVTVRCPGGDRVLEAVDHAFLGVRLRADLGDLALASRRLPFFAAGAAAGIEHHDHHRLLSSGREAAEKVIALG